MLNIEFTVINPLKHDVSINSYQISPGGRLGHMVALSPIDYRSPESHSHKGKEGMEMAKKNRQKFISGRTPA